MPRFSWSRILCGIAFAASGAAVAAEDVDAIAATADVIQEGFGSQSAEVETRYVESFTGLIVENARKIARREGILEAGKVSSEAFVSFVRENVEGVIPPAARKDSARERKKALNTALIAMSTQSYAEVVLSEWLHLPAPAAATGGLGPRASTQLTLGSSDGRLKMHLDEEARFQDLGGPGSENGVADAGEWVKLTLGVYNASATPFVSSSAWVSVDSSSCGWTFPDEEILLPEMSPHDSEAELPNAEMGQINSWIYLSEDCDHKSRVPLRFSIKDTHEASSPIVLTARIEVTNRGVSRVRDYLVDSDVPGFSEGADADTLQIVPDLRFELSHGLNTGPGQIMGAQMAWGMAELSQAMMSAQSYRSEQPMVLEGSTLAFGDDLDLETHAKADTLHTAIDNMGKEWKWSTVDDARLWLLTDTTVSYETMDPPEDLVEEIPDEICDNYLDDDGDGKHDCDDSDCAEADECQDPPQALGINQILKLVKENAAIAASPAKPEIDGAISAVDPNYELVFDQEEFALRYGCMVNGLSFSQCGAEDTHARCTDEIDNDSDGKLDCEDSDCEPICKLIKELEEKESKEEEEAVPEVPLGAQRRNDAVAYVYRHFFVLPIKAPPEGSPETCFDDWDNDLDGKKDCEDSACAELCEKKENDHSEFGENSCRDGEDNDYDRLVDCDDPDCGDDPYCYDESEYSFHGPESCQDGIDNDLRGDGIDCRDKDGCRASPECVRPKLWSLDLAGGMYTLGLADQLMDSDPARVVVWDPSIASSGLAIGALVRASYSWGGRGKEFAPYSLLAKFDAVPGMTVVNSGTGTFQRSSYGVGFAYRLGLTPWLLLEPHVVLGSQSIAVSSGSGRLFSNSDLLAEGGITLRVGTFAAGPIQLSGFLDAVGFNAIGVSVPPPVGEPVEVVKPLPYSIRLGVGLHY